MYNIREQGLNAMFDVLFRCVSIFFPHFLFSCPVSSSNQSNAENEVCSIAVLTVSKHLVCSGSFYH